MGERGQAGEVSSEALIEPSRASQSGVVLHWLYIEILHNKSMLEEDSNSTHPMVLS